MVNCGQVCLAIKRVYVPTPCMTPCAPSWRSSPGRPWSGDGLDPTRRWARCRTRRSSRRSRNFSRTRAQHGKIIAGGKPLERDGYFIAPTIVRDIPDDARLVQEEQFGPVLPVLNTPASTTRSPAPTAPSTAWAARSGAPIAKRAYEVAQRIDSGTVWVNKHLDLPPDIPFGGAKQSGFGTEMGQEGLEEFTQSKIINSAK